ncbi:MAG: ATP-binding protein [Candidatus Kerfeldbacteria bacterium]|nr:ATP-binding protein [Candidatus Kerfeldbacteria bacterium]
MVIERTIQKSIEKTLFKGKIIILYGARQVGKTTLAREIQKSWPGPSLFFNCDEPDVRASLTDVTSTELRSLFGSNRLIVIDEAQRVRNIGITLKLAVDTIPECQILATGSSSFELSNRLVEPLTGRKIEFHLHPFTFEELVHASTLQDVQRLLPRRLIYGMYPEVTQLQTNAEQLISEISGSYLYKDVLEYHHIRKPEMLEKLLQALALQIGNEVSYSELAKLLGISKITVEQYVHLLEQSFIIFRIRPFRKNLRTEIRRLRKIYFYDTGIRNAVIRNLNPLELRQDVGALWENFAMSERMKYHASHQQFINMYFWRTHTQQEIDLLEEKGGVLSGYEMKWSNTPLHVPKAFRESYPDTTIKLIHSKNVHDFLLSSKNGATI